MSIVAIVGHTASGKSAVGEEVAARFGAEIVSVDSMQVYRGMDIGTAKPSPATRAHLPHHMVDVVDVSVDYSVRTFQRTGREAIEQVLTAGGRVVIVGGSGLHFRALVDPLEFAPTDDAVRIRFEELPVQQARERLLRIDPEAGAHVDLANPRRVVRALEIHQLEGLTPTQRARRPAASAVRGYEPFFAHTSIGFDAGAAASDRIEMRWQRMLDAGLVDEVAGLMDRWSRSASQAVGYKELVSVVEGSAPLSAGSAAALGATRALVKRQRTFFGRDPRIAWLPWQDDPDDRVATAVEHIERETAWTS